MNPAIKEGYLVMKIYLPSWNVMYTFLHLVVLLT